MPPRARRHETLERRDARIRKHLAQARIYWSKVPEYLAQGDLCQAREKCWGAVSRLTKAVATLRSWGHYDDVAIQEAVTALAEEMPEQRAVIYDGLGAAEQLHGKFYEVYMTDDRAELALVKVRPLLAILWGLLPGEYTGGVSFSEWAADAN